MNETKSNLSLLLAGAGGLLMLLFLLGNSGNKIEVRANKSANSVNTCSLIFNKTKCNDKYGCKWNEFSHDEACVITCPPPPSRGLHCTATGDCQDDYCGINPTNRSDSYASSFSTPVLIDPALIFNTVTYSAIQNNQDQHAAFDFAEMYSGVSTGDPQIYMNYPRIMTQPITTVTPYTATNNITPQNTYSNSNWWNPCVQANTLTQEEERMCRDGVSPNQNNISYETCANKVKASNCNKAGGSCEFINNTCSLKSGNW